MLDDTKFIQTADKANALAIVAGQPDQLLQSFNVQKIPGDISNIVVAGMGGSALGAEFLRSWLDDVLPVPLVITKGYDLPGFVGPNTLVVASSYSGDTEEALSMLATAVKRKSKIVIMSAGGQLQDYAQKHQLPLMLLPPGYQPRMAVFAGVRALAELFASTQDLKNIIGELETEAKWVKAHVAGWTADQPLEKNGAKQIAQKIFGWPVVVYGGPSMGAVARKWKINFNENSKNLAFSYEWPEFNHNEMLGWAHPRDRKFKVIELWSSLDHLQVAKRFSVTNRLLSGKMPHPLIVDAVGATRLQQMLWAQLLGDFTSIYLAMLNGVNSMNIDMIQNLKKDLA